MTATTRSLVSRTWAVVPIWFSRAGITSRPPCAGRPRCPASLAGQRGLPAHGGRDVMPARLNQMGTTAQVLDTNDRVVAVMGTPPGDAAARVAVAANYTLQGGEQLVAVTSTAAARTLTLPAASSVPVGIPI